MRESDGHDLFIEHSIGYFELNYMMKYLKKWIHLEVHKDYLFIQLMSTQESEPSDVAHILREIRVDFQWCECSDLQMNV